MLLEAKNKNINNLTQNICNKQMFVYPVIMSSKMKHSIQNLLFEGGGDGLKTDLIVPDTRCIAVTNQ